MRSHSQVPSGQHLLLAATIQSTTSLKGASEVGTIAILLQTLMLLYRKSNCCGPRAIMWWSWV